MNKSLVVLLIFVVSNSAVYSQYIVKTFYNSQDEVVSSESESYYYKVAKDRCDTLLTYYTGTNALRSRQMLNEVGTLHGPFVMFHENGRLKMKGANNNGRPIGYFMRWYAEGKPHSVTQYFAEPGTVSAWSVYDFKIINYWDSLGVQKVKDGIGTCDCYFTTESRLPLREKGRVKDGLRDSVWSGFTNNRLAFTERYDNGKFIEGTRVTEGKPLENYTALHVSAEYVGGLKAMSKFIGNHLIYPMKDQTRGESGQAFVHFRVDPTGSLSDFMIIYNTTRTMGEEALRVVKRMPLWVPGKVRGRLASSDFVLPVKFTLQ